MKKKRIAVTGYGPFGAHDVNPSGVIVGRLAEMADKLEEVELETEVIPVAYSAAVNCSTRLCRDSKPDVS
jgi:pyrrolidone-carboxylate peptidase